MDKIITSSEWHTHEGEGTERKEAVDLISPNHRSMSIDVAEEITETAEDRMRPITQYDYCVLLLLIS